MKENLIRLRDILRIWISYFKPCKEVYDFDSNGILIVEKHQLERTLKCIEKNHYHEDSRHSIFWMRTTLNILNKVLNPDIHFDYKRGQHTKVPNVNIRNIKRFCPQLTEDEATDSVRVYLYQKKLWYVYNKIRYYYLLGWWE